LLRGEQPLAQRGVGNILHNHVGIKRDSGGDYGAGGTAATESDAWSREEEPLRGRASEVARGVEQSEATILPFSQLALPPTEISLSGTWRKE
jgi:hypothetical protein